MRITIASTIVIMFARHVKNSIISSLMLTTSLMWGRRNFFLLFLNKMKTKSRSQDMPNISQNHFPCSFSWWRHSSFLRLFPTESMALFTNVWVYEWMKEALPATYGCILIILSFFFNFHSKIIIRMLRHKTYCYF